MPEARLEDHGSGLAPATDGWFVVNVRDAAWVTNERFGAACIFETDAVEFPQIGYTLAVLAPGQPSALYHREDDQEDFLVLSGECIAIVEGEERRMKQWDYLHSPPGTRHITVGAGDGPCAILMYGLRSPDSTIRYPVEPAAAKYGHSVEQETDSAREAYADRPHWALGRPQGWDALPWA